MLNFLNNSISSNSTKADLIKLGAVSFEDLESVPMFNIQYKGHDLKIESKELCGEFEGDCFKFA